MRVLFDTNVLLDVLLAREPHSLAAARLLVAVEEGAITGVLCATSVTTVHYIAAKAAGPRVAEDLLRVVLGLFEVASVSAETVRAALDARSADFEDAVVAESALRAGAAVIVTRDSAGFRHSAVPAMSPDELVALMQATDDHVEIVSI